MSLGELHTASSLLQTAIDRYLGVCLSLQQAAAACDSKIKGSVATVLSKELLQLADYETKLQESKLAVSQSINRCSVVVSISRLPIEALVQVFQLLVEAEYKHHDSKLRLFPEYPLVLSHVCASWRQIVFRSPPLWSRIKLFPIVRADERLQAYTYFHLNQARETPMHVFISECFSVWPVATPNLSAFVIPFARRIRSLELHLSLLDGPSIVGSKKAQAEHLLAKCLETNDGTLVRFILNMIQARSHLFVKGTSEDASHSPLNSLVIELPNDQLEDALSPIVDLRLRGLYFTWQSKAYHGLISLRLDNVRSLSISEFDLKNILKSSPRLKRLDIRLAITQTNAPPSSPPAYLPDMEVLIGNPILLKFIRPGLKELSVSIMDKKGSTSPSDSLSRSVAAKDFFLTANVVKFDSHGFLRNISDICSLFSLAPRLRDLAISHTGFEDPLPDRETPTPVSLDVLYIIMPCVIEGDWLRDVVSRSPIRKIELRGKNIFICDVPKTIDSQTALEEVMSELETRKVQLEFVPRTRARDVSSVDFFVEPSSE